MFFKKAEKYHDNAYTVFRILVGLLFFQHGAQKVLGWFGATAVPLSSMMGVAGIIELVGGLAIFLGLFTRLFALVSGVEMLAAYFMVHAGNNMIPIINQGELALLYLATFIILFIHGNKKASIETMLFKKEFF